MESSEQNDDHLLSDFDGSIDFTLLTSEPDSGTANCIDKIAEISVFIGKQLASEETRKQASAKKSVHKYGSSNVVFSSSNDLKLKATDLHPPASTHRGSPLAKPGLSTIVRRKNSRKNKFPKAQSNENVEKTKRRTRRSKQGCWTCRLRHKACPEDGVPCGACRRLNLVCDVSSQRPRYMLDANRGSQRLQQIKAVTDQLRKSQKS